MICKDAYDRPVSYLRVSVTDRCNLRCFYCMPADGVCWRSHDDILRYEEIETVVRAAAKLGINKVRISGGEPLVRDGIEDLVESLAAIQGIDDLAMTTNGMLLATHANALKRAGLRRVNISVDSLDGQRYRDITGGGNLDEVLTGMDAASEAGLLPIKVNTVVIQGVNDDEVVDFARKTIEAGWNVRFIELMPLWSGQPMVEDWRGLVVTGEEIRRRVEVDLGPLEPASMPAGNGPARYYRFSGAAGTLGFITPVSDHFCRQCNRLRLTADGRLRPCLLSDSEIDLRTPLRSGANPGKIREIIELAVRSKPQKHELDDGRTARSRTMSEIGG